MSFLVLLGFFLVTALSSYLIARSVNMVGRRAVEAEKSEATDQLEGWARHVRDWMDGQAPTPPQPPPAELSDGRTFDTDTAASRWGEAEGARLHHDWAAREQVTPCGCGRPDCEVDRPEVAAARDLETKIALIQDAQRVGLGGTGMLSRTPVSAGRLSGAHAVTACACPMCALPVHARSTHECRPELDGDLFAPDGQPQRGFHLPAREGWVASQPNGTELAAAQALTAELHRLLAAGVIGDEEYRRQVARVADEMAPARQRQATCAAGHPIPPHLRDHEGLRNPCGCPIT